LLARARHGSELALLDRLLDLADVLFLIHLHQVHERVSDATIFALGVNS
jgi:hypothetical protein